MAKSFILENFLRKKVQLGTEGIIHNWFSSGMSAPGAILPEKVIAWIDVRSLLRDPPKSHQRFVLKIALTKGYCSVLDGLRFPVNPGQGLLIFPFQIHTNEEMEKETEAPGKNLIVSFSLPEGGRSLLPLKDRILTLDRKDEELLLNVALSYQSQGSPPGIAVLRLAEFLLRQLEKTEQPDKIRTGSSADTRLDEICAYIRENFVGDLSLKTAADHFGTSPQQIRRLFLKRFGKLLTPGDFLRRLRIQQACELLLCSDGRIGEIGLQCGFSDPFQFSRAFKNQKGMSPAEYRKRFHTEFVGKGK